MTPCEFSTGRYGFGRHPSQGRGVAAHFILYAACTCGLIPSISHLAIGPRKTIFKNGDGTNRSPSNLVLGSVSSCLYIRCFAAVDHTPILEVMCQKVAGRAWVTTIETCASPVVFSSSFSSSSYLVLIIIETWKRHARDLIIWGCTTQRLSLRAHFVDVPLFPASSFPACPSRRRCRVAWKVSSGNLLVERLCAMAAADELYRRECVDVEVQ